MPTPNGSALAAEHEAIVFTSAARDWLDHVLVGDVGVAEGVVAGQLLLTRAESFALAT